MANAIFMDARAFCVNLKSSRSRTENSCCTTTAALVKKKFTA